MDEACPKKMNQRKLNSSLRCAGEAYKSRKGILKEKKSLQPNPCLYTKCQNKCGNINEISRQQIFDSYYALDVQQQKDFIVSSVITRDVKRRYADNNASRRTCTKFYFLPVDGELKKVCQQFFLKTLNISQKFLRYTDLHKTSHCTAKSDGRGKKLPVNEAQFCDQPKTFILNEEKSMQPNPCISMKCQNKCGGINEISRQRIFDWYYALDVQQQNDFIESSVVTKEVKRRRTSNDASRRSCTKLYFLPVNAENKKVCQQFFLKTLDISKKSLKRTYVHQNNIYSPINDEVCEEKPENNAKLDDKSEKMISKGNKSLQPNPCISMKCQNKCGTIDETIRQDIFDSYYALDVQQQKNFIVSSIITEEVKRRYADNNASRRSCTKFYFLPVNGELKKVCQQFFLKTLDISQKFLRYTDLHKTSICTAKSDGRGKTVTGKKRKLNSS